MIQDLMAKKRKKTQMTKNRILFLCCMLAIPILHFCVFWIYINFSSILLGFQTARGEWTLNNFVMFWDSLKTGTIGLALKNTMIYFLSNLLFTFPVGLLISYFLYKKCIGSKIFRYIFYLPSIISGVALTGVFMQVIKPWGALGVIANALNINFPADGLLGTAETATWTIVAYCIWTGLGGNILLFSGTMARIPLDVLEAAKIEGCGPFREVTSIIAPLIWPTLSTLIIFQMTGIFSASGPILLFTNGAYDTYTISFWIFAQVYGEGGGSGSYGLVSATGLVFTVVGVAFILVVRKLMEKVTLTEY